MAKKEVKEGGKLSRKERDELVDRFLKPFRVTDGKGFRLKDIDPGDTRGLKSKEHAESLLERGIELLAKQKMPKSLVTKDIWTERFEDISNFEQYLARNGYAIAKIFLHVSKKAQKERFLERLETPEKNWKFSSADAKERAFWDDYMDAYEDLIRHTATKHAPWYVVPADRKWFARFVVAAAIYDTMAGRDLKFPKVDEAKLQDLAVARAQLLSEGKKKP